jgi:hypothetical protein
MVIIAAVISGVIGAFWYFMASISYPFRSRPTLGNPEWDIRENKSGSDARYYSIALGASWAFLGVTIGLVLSMVL